MQTQIILCFHVNCFSQINNMRCSLWQEFRCAPQGSLPAEAVALGFRFKSEGAVGFDASPQVHFLRAARAAYLLSVRYATNTRGLVVRGGDNR